MPYKFLDIEPQFSSLNNSRFVVIPMPFEKTTSYGKGTKNGPSAILAASQIIEDYDIELGCEIYKKVGIHTMAPVRFSKDPHKDMYSAVKKVLSAGKIPVILGGEHSISYGPVKAAKEKYKDLSVLQFDAHSDLRDSYHGGKHSHACIMRRVREMCSAVQVGIRSQDKEEADYIKSCKIANTIYFAHNFSSSKNKEIINRLSKNVYLTVDVDVFDPSIIPSTGTPEPGGLNWDQVTSLIKLLADKKNVVGVDFVELAPKKGVAYPDFTIAKLIYKTIGYISRNF